MTIHVIHLKKLLKLFYCSESKLRSELRADVWTKINKEDGIDSDGGGDFHVPFWSDAKDHMSGATDLTTQTLRRIADHRARARLYPQLSKGFLDWWNEKRRWSNEGFSIAADSPHGRHEVKGGIVKVENILSLVIGTQPTRYFYPYFSETPILSSESARIGLWIMHKALPDIPAEQLRILDILRSKSFSLKKYPFQGNEEKLAQENYLRILKKWDELYEEIRNDK